MDNIKIDNFIKKNGKHADKILTILGKDTKFVNALNTPVGEELLKDMLAMMEDRLTKIVNEESTEADRAEYRVLKELSRKWIDRINRRNDILEAINKP